GMGVVADVLGETADDSGPLSTPAHVRLMRERPERKAHTERILRSASPHMYAALLREISVQEDRLERLRELMMPTLVVVGEQDRPFLAASRRMADRIADPRLAGIPDGGHSPQLEAPDAWWRAVSTFLAQHHPVG